MGAFNAPTVAFKVVPNPSAPKGAVVCTIGSDNTASALNVVPEYEKLTQSKLPGGEWPCPTHINALEGKNSVEALCKPPPDRSGVVPTGFNAENALNIADKWWYVCDKHWNFVQHWWVQLKLKSKLVRPKRGLMGKWETVGAAHQAIHLHADDIREFVHEMEHLSVGIDNMGTFRDDCKLLMEWMHDPRLWFHFLVTLEWFTDRIEPVFEWLRGRSKIYPASGRHFARERVPRIALQATVRAGKLPTMDDSLEQIEAKAKPVFPLAVEHVNLKPNRGPTGLSGGYKRFEISSNDKAEYLRALAQDFTPEAQDVVKDHWSKFLSGWKMFGNWDDH